MIVSDTFYAVKCDRCGNVCDDSDTSYWSDEDRAIEKALEDNWAEVGNKHYCSNCCEIDEETGEVTVFEEYSKQLKALNAFVDYVLGAYNREVLEYNAYILVKFKLHNKLNLSEVENDYINGLLADNFISIDYQKDNYNNTVCLVKLKR